MPHIDIANRRKMPRVNTMWVKNIAKQILLGLDLADAELSVSLVGDAEIHALNKQWRHKDKPTDVLSFAHAEAGMPGPSHHLGDVVVSMDTAAVQAERIGHSLEDEVVRLLIHGVLHLVGYDHVHGGVQARNMKREEERLLLACCK